MACSKLGAVWLPLFSGFGADAVAKRLEDAEATVLITADGFPRRGKVVPMKETADEAVAAGGSVRHVDRRGSPGPNRTRRGTPDRDIRWDDLLASNADRFETARPGSRTPAVHRVHERDDRHAEGCRARPRQASSSRSPRRSRTRSTCGPASCLFWFADLGWIMGPWEIVGATALGATVFLYDGAPNHPGPDRLWSIVERHRHHAPRGLAHAGARADPVRATSRSARHDLSSLRILASTGEPWNPSPYRWFFEEVGEGRAADHQPLGRDRGRARASCRRTRSALLEPLLAAGPALGMDVDVFRPDGTAGGRRRGRRARVPQPWPSMTRGLRGDPERYLDAYWRRLPGRVVPRRLGERRRGRAVVPARAQRRHDERRGQAPRPGRGREHPDAAPAASPSPPSVGVPDEVKGEAIWCFVVANGEVPDGLAGRALGPGGRTPWARRSGPRGWSWYPELPRIAFGEDPAPGASARRSCGEDPGDLSSLEKPLLPGVDPFRARLGGMCATR